MCDGSFAVLRLACLMRTIEQLLTANSISRMEMADMLGRSTRTIDRWFAGDTQMSATDLIMTVRQLGYDVVIMKNVAYENKLMVGTRDDEPFSSTERSQRRG